MKIKQRATITSINDLNKNFEVKMTEFQFGFTLTLILDNDGNILPKKSFEYYLEVGDLIEFKMKKNQKNCEMFNLSCQYLRFSKFRRDFISIFRRLNNDNHPLKRCVLLNEPGCVLLSIKKNSDKINAITEATQISEENHEKF